MSEMSLLSSTSDFAARRRRLGVRSVRRRSSCFAAAFLLAAGCRWIGSSKTPTGFGQNIPYPQVPLLLLS
jgi:hypothetical protein